MNVVLGRTVLIQYIALLTLKPEGCHRIQDAGERSRTNGRPLRTVTLPHAMSLGPATIGEFSLAGKTDQGLCVEAAGSLFMIVGFLCGLYWAWDRWTKRVDQPLN